MALSLTLILLTQVRQVINMAIDMSHPYRKKPVYCFLALHFEKHHDSLPGKTEIKRQRMARSAANTAEIAAQAQADYMARYLMEHTYLMDNGADNYYDTAHLQRAPKF